MKTNRLIDDQIKLTRNRLKEELGVTSVNEEYSDYSISKPLNELTEQELKELSTYISQAPLGNFKKVEHISTKTNEPIRRTTLSSGTILDAHTFLFKNAISKKATRQITFKSNGEVSISRVQKKEKEYQTFTSSGNLRKDSFKATLSGEDIISIEHNSLLTRKRFNESTIEHNNDTINYYLNNDSPKLTTSINLSLSKDYKLLSAHIKSTQKQTKEEYSYEVNSTGIVISYTNKDGIKKECTIRTVILPGSTLSFQEILGVLKAIKTVIIPSHTNNDLLKDILSSIKQGIEESIITGNTTYYNLDQIKELDIIISNELKKYIGEIAIPELLSMIQTYFQKEKLKKEKAL